MGNIIFPIEVGPHCKAYEDKAHVVVSRSGCNAISKCGPLYKSNIVPQNMILLIMFLRITLL